MGLGLPDTAVLGAVLFDRLPCDLVGLLMKKKPPCTCNAYRLPHHHFVEVDEIEDEDERAERERAEWEANLTRRECLEIQRARDAGVD